MGGQKILVVDDEADICLLLTNMLQKLGYETLQANTLNNGWLQLLKESPIMVFLDLNLPDGSGLSLLSRIKLLNSNIDVIVISAHDSERERQQAKQLGANSFIGKPLSRIAIMEALTALKGKATA
jgi:DNA-binding response OmpR family regulator